jgi:hypothetical protein
MDCLNFAFQFLVDLAIRGLLLVLSPALLLKTAYTHNADIISRQRGQNPLPDVPLVSHQPSSPGAVLAL